MFHELLHALVNRIFRDKILLALVIIGILAIFAGGMGQNNESNPNPGAADKTAAGQATNSQNPTTMGARVEPDLACDFIKWWLASAMDYSSPTAQQSHHKAVSWMTAGPASTFTESFWSPETASAITSGRTVASFQVGKIQPIAVNPDGSVVVEATGTLVAQSGGAPVVQQLQMDYLVQRQVEGLRVAGLFNKVVTPPANSVN